MRCRQRTLEPIGRPAGKPSMDEIVAWPETWAWRPHIDSSPSVTVVKEEPSIRIH